MPLILCPDLDLCLGYNSEMAGGRPIEPVPQDIAEQVVVWLASGKTLRDFCRLPGMPHYSTIYDWLDKDDEFTQRFARARATGEDVISQECLSIADDDTRDVSGELEIPNGVAVQRDKLRIDTRLKLLAKWSPKKWGDKVQTEISGPAGGPLEVSLAASISQARKRVGIE